MALKYALKAFSDIYGRYDYLTEAKLSGDGSSSHWVDDPEGAIRFDTLADAFAAAGLFAPSMKQGGYRVEVEEFEDFSD